MRVMAVPPPIVSLGMGVQVHAQVVSTVNVQTNVSHTHMVHGTTYSLVASQTSPKVVPASQSVHIEMTKMGLVLWDLYLSL